MSVSEKQDLRVVDVASAEVPEVEADAYVDLRVRWRVGPVLHWRAFRRISRLPTVELKLDPISGAVIGLTIQNLPAAVPGEVVLGTAEPGVPVLDRSPFGLNPDLVAEVDRVDVQVEPSVVVDEWLALIRFGDAAAERWLMGGPVAFGIDGDDHLVALAVDRGAVPEASSLSP